MSRWTHVAGVIRVDSIPGVIPDPEFSKIFKTFNYHNAETMRNSCNVPYGSEGSLQVSVYTNPATVGVPRFIVTIWGDLRDFGDDNDMVLMKKWWKKTLKQFPMIRQAVLKVDDEHEENSFILKT
jgi:hypothetical protein